jgi:hypothetical protein
LTSKILIKEKKIQYKTTNENLKKFLIEYVKVYSTKEKNTLSPQQRQLVKLLPIVLRENPTPEQKIQLEALLLKNSSRLDEYLGKFSLTKQFYSFNYGNVHFLAMSSEIPFDKDSKQYRFVNDDLKSASENKSINWIVAFIYEMLYTSPTFHKPTDTIRDIYHPIFDKYHVDLVLQAHSHNYQRTYPLKYNEKMLQTQ